MPEYLKRTGRDVTDDILVRVPESEKHIARLKGPATKRLGIDRGSIPSVAAPLEGQMMIQYADEAVGATPVSPDVGATFKGESPYYYSNGEWRPFTSAATSDEEHLYVASTSVGGITAGFLDLARYAGGTFIDLTDTKKAMVTETGVYTASGSVHVFPPSSEPAGDGVDFGVTAVQGTIAWPPATPLPGVGTFVNSVLGTGQNDNWFGTASVTAIMQANADWFQVAVDNHNSYAVDVVVGLSIVRIV